MPGDDTSKIIVEHETEWFLKACGGVYTFGIIPKCRGCPHLTHEDHKLCTFNLELQHEYRHKTHTEILQEISEGKKSFFISSCDKKRKVHLKMTKDKLGESFSSECSTDGRMLFTCKSIYEEQTCDET